MASQYAGLTRITGALAGLTYWLAWGTGTGQPASANALATAAAEARVTAVPSSISSGSYGSANDQLQLTATITAGGSRAITEVGAFDALTSGNMDWYGSFSVNNLNSGDSIAFTMKVSFT